METPDTLATHYVAALIPAAGSGVRMGGALPKPYQLLGGREILARTLDVFEACKAINEVWLVVSADQADYCRRKIIELYGFRKVQGLIVGGEERQDSVLNGLQRLGPNVNLVVVHDGVRPFVTETLLNNTLKHAVWRGAAIAAVPLKDTLKQVSADGVIEATVPREHLWRTQTPQAFQRAVLERAFAQAKQKGWQMTDEAGLVELSGHPVYVVPGAEQNLKITTPDDLILAERFLSAER